ncbi:MAG: hypothetical protein CM15mP32_4950 [Flavobacteriaceae bacterium]|nr:MAG: hypothetical protein CM15mP32_4950 [Flavobacteriaceae bacterium]
MTEFVGTNTFFKTTARLGIFPFGGIFIFLIIWGFSPGNFCSPRKFLTIQGERPQVGDAKYRDVSGRDENGLLTGVPEGKKINLNDDRVFTIPFQNPKFWGLT